MIQIIAESLLNLNNQTQVTCVKDRSGNPFCLFGKKIGTESLTHRGTPSLAPDLAH